MTPTAHRASEGRPLRADARRNRLRILEAADAVFTAVGPGATTEEVAQLAGVAIGTIFRHFPTKESLIEAVLVQRLDHLVADARALAETDDPGAAFYAFLAWMVDQTAAKHSFAAALAGAGIGSAPLDSAMSQVRQAFDDAMGRLLDRGQQVGAVRTDISLPELMAVLLGAFRAAEYSAGEPEIQSRATAIIFDGLRPGAGN
ncbi:TetR/AcrR family transcriptional regulator [Nocardia amamiensis]|uniref:TetR/AcrR family transcriptional regulator n=1 Tax=Nocardia amamiensis TaxID=404578 RepID=A0ABS0D4I4_9NOCA|nr:TetR/AcrR family transcriptional regulator [Nocardia amamiensis]MBF6302912.1 TetR/AcrR family transcriptional regulator [Nocardia amamiensis]